MSGLVSVELLCYRCIIRTINIHNKNTILALWNCGVGYGVGLHVENSGVILLYTAKSKTKLRAKKTVKEVKTCMWPLQPQLESMALSMVL